ncbi:AraC family transcriptional regulator (plasmid) [Fulvitalea axinellae]|uniref:AraC family transcriptional regulator n=1 Tax=Fulvitalea axinellae TaxID=1182444 RepID=A0AAU9DDY7_9BACT|nr:AraC family transcriptional regulator [Fulvitalea axinellae]
MEHPKIYNTESLINAYLRSEGKSHINPVLSDFFCIRLEEINPFVDYPIRPSVVKSATLIYITAGTFCITLGSEHFEVKPGHVLLIQANKVFSVEIMDDDIRGYTCHFHPDMLAGHIGNRLDCLDILDTWSASEFTLDEDRARFFENIYLRLYHEYYSEYPSQEIIQAYLLALLFELNGIPGSRFSSENKTAARLTHTFKHQLSESLADGITLRDLAERLNVSQNYLNRCVREVTGMTATMMIDKARLLKAKNLLRQTNLSVGRIAESVGIYDSSYFSRFFKKHEGLTPKQFRNKEPKS